MGDQRDELPHLKHLIRWSIFISIKTVGSLHVPWLCVQPRVHISPRDRIERVYYVESAGFSIDYFLAFECLFVYFDSPYFVCCVLQCSVSSHIFLIGDCTMASPFHVEN